jgi:glycosyltransferase involved in cell wall biosynthesis
MGNLEPRKNLGTLVRAHGMAREVDPSVPPLALVGPSGWGDRWQGSPPDPRHVLLIGYLADADLRSAVAGAQAVCMPSHYEGFGLPVLEALAAGRTVLASDIPAHREVAQGHATLLAAQDVDAWAEALCSLGSDDVSSPQREAERRAHASGFTWRKSAQAHVRAYRAQALTRGRH